MPAARSAGLERRFSIGFGCPFFAGAFEFVKGWPSFLAADIPLNRDTIGFRILQAGCKSAFRQPWAIGSALKFLSPYWGIHLFASPMYPAKPSSLRDWLEPAQPHGIDTL